MWTQERVNKYWHLLVALKEGKVVEVFNNGEWGTLKSIHFGSDVSHYRIAPPPPVVTQRFVNVYCAGFCGTVYRTRAEADVDARDSRHTRSGILITTLHNDVFFKQEVEPCC